MKIISYNVNGIRAALKKGFIEWLQQANPDVICIQETKAHKEQLDLSIFEAAGYSVANAVNILVLLSVVFAAIGVSSQLWGTDDFILFLVFVFVFVLYYIGMLRAWKVVKLIRKKT